MTKVVRIGRRDLMRGGAEVTYFVRERYVDELRAGTTLHALPRGGARTLRPTHVRSDVDGVAEGFDQVWLCVPTNALTSGALDPVLAAVAKAERTSLVSMPPGMQVRALIDLHVPRARVVDGMIGMIAYQAPLPGETLAPGIASQQRVASRSAPQSLRIGMIVAGQSDESRCHKGNFGAGVIDEVEHVDAASPGSPQRQKTSPCALKIHLEPAAQACSFLDRAGVGQGVGGTLWHRGHGSRARTRYQFDLIPYLATGNVSRLSMRGMIGDFLQK